MSSVWKLVLFQFCFALVYLLSCTGCSPSDKAMLVVEQNQDPESDQTDELFRRSRLLAFHIELDPDDWNELRFQELDDGDINIIPPECLPPTEPFPSPFTWFSGTVTIDGERFENIGLRKKGFFGSISATRPSLKIRLDKFVDDQSFLDTERITLNNAQQDESIVRQCLAYDLFQAAGVPASRCNFAHVIVNDVDLGVYVNVEEIKKPFLRRHFEDEDGLLYEGTLSDFREGWTGTIEQKNDEDEPNTEAIDAITEALTKADDELIEALSTRLDLDAFLRFWAMETITSHWDGYAGNTNNFHFYDDPTSGKVHFIPWGTDGTFIDPLMLFEERRAPHSINAAGLIARRLYLNTEGQQLYIERLLSLLDAHWDPELLQVSIEEMAEVFEEAVPSAYEQAVQNGLSETISFVHEHGDKIRSEIEQGPEVWDTPLREGLCFEGDSEYEVGTEWNAYVELAEGQGGFEYIRLEEDGEFCLFYGEMTELTSVDDCGDGCNFAMEMSISNTEINIEEGSNCSDEELSLFEGIYIFAQGNIIIFEDEDYTVYQLFQYEVDEWSVVDNGYSLLFDDSWYFGYELD